MEYLKKIFRTINNSTILRNLCLAFCGIIIFAFVVSILLNLFTRHNSYKQVPDFKGMSMVEAEKAARKANLELEVNDSLYLAGCEPGVILDQMPSAEREVKSGRRIFLTINAHNRKMVEIPYVTGYSLRQAKNNLEVAGLEIARLVYQPDLATNYVLEQRYDGKTINQGSKVIAEMGSGVTLIVGKSPDAGRCKVPKLIGYSLKEAKSRLWEVGLNVGKIDLNGISEVELKDARVYIQQPGQGNYLHLGEQVSISLTLNEEDVEKSSKQSDVAAKKIVAPPADEIEITEEETTEDII